jgi:undecaprenyl-phosphate 4-deoxy-4-formamido-L-arabinose transferase
VDVSVVIPCYQEGDCLASMLEKLGGALDDVPGTAELVLVDDGSTDATGDRAVALASDFRHPTRVVRLVRNFGQHPAVFAGLEHARGAVVVTMDSDLQYPPHEMLRLVAEVSPDWPVVSGYRADRRDPWLRRRLTGFMTRWLNRQTKTDLNDFGSMFRAYDRTVVERMLQVTERHRFVPAVVAWLGVPIKEIAVEHQARDERGSRYRLGTLADMFLDLVTGYSVFPLRLLTALGLAASLVGFLATLAFIAYRIFVGGGVSGTVSAFAVIFFLLGVQLLIVALVGEYVGRIYTEAKGRPYYIVNDVVENSAARTSTKANRLDNPLDPASV